jgi:glutamate racemase
VGVLATRLTVRSGAYVRAIRDLDPFVDVYQVAAPRLVPLIEAGGARSPEAREAVREYVMPMLSEGAVVSPGVDTLLLGCTHYPLVRWAIEEVAGPGVRVVDSATTTALAVREVLDSHGLRSTATSATHQVHATGDGRRFREIAHAMFKEDVAIREARLA